MAERQSGVKDFDETERERLSKKLDGYEAMGLEVEALRQLLDEDIVKFKETYLSEIRTQLEGGGDEREDEGPAPEEEPGLGPEVSTEEGAVIEEEDAEEELELELEGTGPEAALLALDEPVDGEEREEATEVTPEEAVRISIGEQVEPVQEEASQVEPEQEEAPQVEPEEEGEPPLGGETPEEEGPTPPEDEEEGPAEGVREGEGALDEEEEEAEIQISPDEVEEAVPEEEPPVEGEAPEEETPEEEEAGVEPEPAAAEEALIVVASMVEEAAEEGPGPEEETEILLSGIEPEKEAAEEPPEAPAAPPPKLVRPRPRPVTAPEEEPTPKPRARPAAKAEPPVIERVKPSPRTVKGRRRLSTGVIAIASVAVLVIAGVGSYFMFFQNEDPIAIFAWDIEEPTVGEMVRFDASASYDPDEHAITGYRWAFGDGTTGKGRFVDHSFLSSETFTVTLTVRDEKGGEASTHRKVTANPLQVSMDPPHVDDIFDYSVSGNAWIFNVDGLVTFKVGTKVYKVYRVDATDIMGTKTFMVTQMGTADDGFLQTHDVRVEQITYDLDDISGEIETELSVNPSFTGSIFARVDEEICLEWERTVRSSVSMDSSFSAPLWADLTSSDDGVFYGQLDGIADTFSIDEFLRETSFSSEDRNVHRLAVGDGIYEWQVQGMERVPGRTSPSILIRVTMDEDTMEANMLTSFFTDVWLEPGLSQPAKNHVFTKGLQDGNLFEVNLTETLTSAQLGSEEATGECTGDHEFSQKEENPESFITLDRVPERGGTGEQFKFSPRETLVAARTDTPDLNIWLNNNPTAFFNLGSYSESGGYGTWTMDFGDRGLSEHYIVKATGRTALDLATEADPETDNTRPLSTQAVIGEVATLTHGLRLMREEPNIRNRCFGDNVPDWSRYTFNITEGVTVLSLDPGSALSGAQETGYVYLLVSKVHNPEYKAALDATNGQILFSWTHSYAFEPLGS